MTIKSSFEINKRLGKSQFQNQPCSIWKIVKVVGVVAALASALFSGVQFGTHDVRVITRTQIPPSNVNPFFFLQSPLASNVYNYFENKPISLLVDSSNAYQVLKILDKIEWDEKADLKEKCQEVLEGKIDSFQMDSFCRPTQTLSPYQGSSRKKKSHAPGTLFPYEFRMLHPGLVLVGRGDKGYKIGHPSLLENHELSLDRMFQEELLIENSPSKKRFIYSSNGLDGKGNSLQPGKKFSGPVFNVDPIKTDNHRNAVKFFQNSFTQLETMSDQKICQTLLGTHKLLLKDLHPNAGSYRQKTMFVFADNEADQDRTAEGLINQVRKMGTASDVDHFISFLKRTGGHMESARPNEVRILNLIGYFAPWPKQVPQLMMDFANELKNQVFRMKECGSYDPIGLAAYAHFKIGEIHPFSDGNGRMARLVMNEILKMGGYLPVAFPNDDDYTKAIKENHKQPGAFANYLRTVAIPWTERQFSSERCLRLLSCPEG